MSIDLNAIKTKRDFLFAQRDKGMEKAANIRGQIDDLNDQLKDAESAIAVWDGKIETLDELLEESERETPQLALDFKPPTSLKEAVHAVVLRQHGRFTRSQIMNIVRSENPDMEFSDRAVESPILALQKEGIVEKVFQGNSKMPSYYIVKPKV